MNWEKGDKYHLKATGFTICCVNLKETRCYELWSTKTRECLASGKVIGRNEVEEQKLIQHLKDVAEAA